jgi:hypothetical protein
LAENQLPSDEGKSGQCGLEHQDTHAGELEEKGEENLEEEQNRTNDLMLRIERMTYIEIENCQYRLTCMLNVTIKPFCQAKI